MRDIKSDAEPEPMPSQSEQPGPWPGVTSGTEVVAKFVAAVDARDAPAALALVCPNAPATTRDGTKQVANGEPEFTVKSTDVLRTTKTTIGHLEGRLDGVAGPGRVDTDDTAAPGPCVAAFSPDSD
ncbi:hypothetical protein [Amycolatopsis sp. H20-H5]|uniref:hypothetical protein n=1 Tax=Amycolatopsis sp. H20-H5 TaxID=3046309 RepID=UPI002DBDE277|nr:hypothetical protein [Amycolatopsis sp. H20-H5]MEC3977052.1 hypothetical protein [Amycolatopsis sp. H20-H5]